MEEILILCLEFLDLDIVILLEFLIPKYASFQTRHLLGALRILFKELYSINKDTFLSTVVRGLDLAVNRVTLKANAVSNYFTLLDWVNNVLLLSSKDNENFTKYLPDLVIWQATLLQHCLAEAKKKGMKVSAFRTTRASLRGVFQQKESISNSNAVENFIRILVGSKISPFAAATLLGIVAGVCKRLRNDTPRGVIESSKNTYYDFFIKEIIGSRIRMPSYVMV
jgi:hypothetical protein